MTSTHLLEDMELINLVMKKIRPDGKPNAPVWITKEGNEVSFAVLFCQTHLLLHILLFTVPIFNFELGLDKFV